MSVIFTESFAWMASSGTTTTDAILADKNYITGLGHPQVFNVASGSVNPPWTGAWFATWVGALLVAIGDYFSGSKRRLIVGARYLFDSASPGYLSIAIGADNDSLKIDNNNGSSSWRVLQGASDTVVGSFSFTSTVDTWYYVEADFNEAGNLVVRINGVQQISIAVSQAVDITNVNWTCNTNVWFADLYVLDPTTGLNTSFLGDVRIECRRPNGAGAATNWAPLANANWQEVDDSPTPDGDTSYVQSIGLGNRDYYAQPNIIEASPSNVFAMAVYAIAKTAAAGAGAIRASIYSSGTQLDGSNAIVPSAGAYGFGGSVVSDTDPHTSAAWTASGVNAAQPGQVLSS